MLLLAADSVGTQVGHRKNNCLFKTNRALETVSKQSFEINCVLAFLVVSHDILDDIDTDLLWQEN